MKVAKRRLRLIALGAGLLAVAPLMLAATSGHATLRSAAVACGQTLRASATLTSDLNCGSGDGLDVGANGITINLHGFAISGAGGSVGVNDPGFTGVTIENGTVSNFTLGVSITGASAGSRVTGIQASASGNGIYIGSDKVTATGNVAVGNSSGIALNGGSGDVVTSNVSDDSTNEGFQIEGVTSVSVTANKALNNGAEGFDIIGASTGTLTGNIANGNADDGIDAPVSSAGYGKHLTLSKNRAAFNANLGIAATLPGALDGGSNVVQQDGAAVACQGVACVAVSS